MQIPVLHQTRRKHRRSSSQQTPDNRPNTTTHKIQATNKNTHEPQNPQTHKTRKPTATPQAHQTSQDIKANQPSNPKHQKA